MSNTVHGKCSECGGIVSTPDSYMSVVPPVPTCNTCGAVRETEMPVIKMKPVPRPEDAQRPDNPQ